LLSLKAIAQILGYKLASTEKRDRAGPHLLRRDSEQARSQIVLGDSLKYNMTAGHNRRRVRYYNPHGFLGDLFPTFKGDKSISLSLV
jgi:hypothetical protein